MQVKTTVKAGGLVTNHNETQVRGAASGLKIKTYPKAGPRARSKLRVRTGVKAGKQFQPCI